MVAVVRSGSDAGLLSAAIGGDEAAFDALVSPLIAPGFKLAVVMLRDGEESRDALQEACLVAWKRLFQLREEAQVRPWFLSIVANRCRSVRRARWWSTLRVPSVQDDLDEYPANLEAGLDLDRELRKLRTPERTALFLFFYLDLPLAEVAKILDVSPQAAKSRVHRAVTKLRLSMLEVSS